MDTFRPGGLKLTQKAAQAIRLCAGQMVLDVGCGAGATLEFLMRRYYVRACGIDRSEAAISRAHAVAPWAELRVADGCALPYPDETFDAVFMECTLPMMRDAEAALREAVRVLRPGGHIVISGLSAKRIGESDAELCSRGRLVEENLRAAFDMLDLMPVLWEDENDALIQFCADAIFHYGSISDYLAAAQTDLGGCVLNCQVPIKGTGYLLAAAQKSAVTLSAIK